MSVLAINGGEKTRNGSFPVWPQYGKKEIENLVEVVESGSMCRLNGNKVSLFENEFAQYQGAKHALCVSNGTVALEIALRCVDVGPGDEVIVPPLSFITTVSSVLYMRAIPVFADVDNTCCITAESIEANITERTKAVVLVHFGGYPANMDSIMEVSKKHNLTVIEDCAHAHGTTYKGRKVGAIGDIGTFSFQESKTITSGEGGAITTNNEKYFELAESYHHIGRIKGRPFYEHHRLASNARLTELQAAVLLAQLQNNEKYFSVRQENAKYLSDRLEEIEGVYPFRNKRDSDVKRNYFFYMFGYDKKLFDGISKERFIEALSAEGISCNAGIPILYSSPLFQEQNYFKYGCPISCKFTRSTVDYKNTYCPNAEKMHESYVRIPHRFLMGTRKDMDDIVKAIKKVRENTNEL